eukprot:scpid97671/ scgid11695/ 
MNLPPPVSKAAFQRHQRKVHSATKSIAESSMQQAVAEVKAVNAEKEPADCTVAVTFDGMWMKRGFTSLHGVFTCIHWETGRVLDLKVSTKYCQACKQWKERKEHNKISHGEYTAWKDGHSANCPVNTQRSSPGMESEAAVVLWQRSVERNDLQYNIFIGDGDSKSFTAVKDVQPYGLN